MINRIVDFLDRKLTAWERRTREARIQANKSQEEEFAEKQLNLFD